MTAHAPNVHQFAVADAAQVEGGWLVTASEVRVEPGSPPQAFFRHGWHSFSVAGWVDAAYGYEPIVIPALRMVDDDPAHTDEPWHSSAWVGAYRDADGEVTLLGALGLDARVHALDGRLVGRSAVGSELTWFVARGEEHTVFGAYAQLLGRHVGRRSTAVPRLWSSWYSYYEDITEQTLRDTLIDVTGWPIDVFQVDDGWQQAVGDWEANADFPTGMADLAARIQASGYRPGLWIAPFIAWPSSQLFRDRPEWFVHDEHGDPVPAGYNWRDWYYALDLSREDVLVWVEHVIRSARAWGFEVLKLDFLFAGAIPGTRSMGLPREVLYRRAVERIRSAAGEDAYLLACGAPIVPSLGVFDAIRISNDVSPFWDNPSLTEVVGAVSEVATRGAIATSLHRLWLRELIATDPDVVFFRSRANLMDDEQRRWLQDLAVLAGFRGTSDPAAWLDEHERGALVAWLEAEPKLEHHGGYRYSIDGREVDFSALADRPRPLGRQAGPVGSTKL